MRFTSNEKLDFYLSNLDKMIEYYCIFNVDETIGVGFMSSKSVDNVDIANEDILKIVKDSYLEVITNSSYMMTCLMFHFSRKWISEYTRMRCMEIVLAYVKNKTIK